MLDYDPYFTGHVSRQISGRHDKELLDSEKNVANEVDVKNGNEKAITVE
jgi:hypothetical protein